MTLLGVGLPQTPPWLMSYCIFLQDQNTVLAMFFIQLWLILNPECMHLCAGPELV